MLCFDNLFGLVGNHSAYFVAPRVTSRCQRDYLWYIGGPGMATVDITSFYFSE